MMFKTIDKLDDSIKVNNNYYSDYLRYFIRCLACVNRGVDYKSVKNVLDKYGTNPGRSTKAESYYTKWIN